MLHLSWTSFLQYEFVSSSVCPHLKSIFSALYAVFIKHSNVFAVRMLIFLFVYIDVHYISRCVIGEDRKQCRGQEPCQLEEVISSWLRNRMCHNLLDTTFLMTQQVLNFKYIIIYMIKERSWSRLDLTHINCIFSLLLLGFSK